MGAKAFPFTRRIKVCAGGTVRKSHSVTPGDLARSLAGNRGKRTYKPASEMEGDVGRGVGRPNSTGRAVKVVRPHVRQPSGLGKSVGKVVGTNQDVSE